MRVLASVARADSEREKCGAAAAHGDGRAEGLTANCAEPAGRLLEAAAS